ncbi:MAG: sulfotransferase, partial [Candidatus Binatia bacterium]
DMRRAVAEWKKTVQACDRLISRFSGSDVVTVKYEDLCADPTSTLRRILKLVDLDASAARWTAPNNRCHILGNNDMRLNFDPNKRILADEKWKRELLPSDVKAFTAVGGALNRQFGY